MGLLKQGVWHTDWYDTGSTGGAFEREETTFRSWITAPGAQAETPPSTHLAESGRYHLYVSYACPWASRTLIVRSLKNLESIIPVSVVDADMLEQGWSFSNAFEGNADPVHGARYLHELYVRAKPDYTGRVTVPVLWDKKLDTIVSNESADIIEMFNNAFDHLTDNTEDFHPASWRAEIGAINARVYDHVNNGVYKCGFATRQAAYEKAFYALFETLDWLEEHLSRRRYLVGDTITLADVRLFTTLVRFDAVYFGHFKCNRQRIEDFPMLSGYLRDLYQHPPFGGTTHFDHIKRHYYYSHDRINPNRIVPLGPELDLTRPHGREHLSSA
jgi:putative glutathione S-transferase